MWQKLVVLSVFIIVMAGCSDHGHSHGDNSNNHAPNKHDSIN